MYIQSVDIRNIRSIRKFEMNFKSYAGWHVLIGDNGSGKSTIIKSVALALVGPNEAPGLRANWADWLNRESNDGEIHLELWVDSSDAQTGRGAKLGNYTFPDKLFFKRDNGSVTFSSNIGTGRLKPDRFNWGWGSGWFSAAYGPYRRFAGGNPEWSKVFYAQPKLGAHLSAFGEDVALTEALEWLIKLDHQMLERNESDGILKDLKRLINSNEFLPHNAKLDRVNSAGVFFKDGNGAEIHVDQLSDGYRSILSLTFELIRQLVRVYGEYEVFKQIRSSTNDNDLQIPVVGVVLIDEIDAHLHPTWQTRIGQWFTKYFPRIQFIVTTHSPLICRACEKGSIWRLAAPGSDMKSEEITGTDRDKLIYGNVLDAYGTEIFGDDVAISDDSIIMREELVLLNNKSTVGALPKEEEKRLEELRKIFTTDDPIEL